MNKTQYTIGVKFSLVIPINAIIGRPMYKDEVR